MAKKTLNGQWRTPIPIDFIDDDERSVENRRCFRGKERDNIRLSVERLEKKLPDGSVKVERLVTLRWFGDNDDGTVNLEEEKFMMNGRAGLRYDKIKWDNGCVWTRYGSSEHDKEEIKRNKAQSAADPQHSAPPPDVETRAKGIEMRADPEHGMPPPEAETFAHLVPKRFRPEARHSASRPDFETQLKEVQKSLAKDMEKAMVAVARRKAAEAAAAQQDREAPQAQSPSLVPEAVHAAPPPEQSGMDTEAEVPVRRVLQLEGEHAMFCGCCGSKPHVLEDEAPPEEPLPEARDMTDGFFGEDQVEDIVDRINDVVGIWGVSESAEREFIKPPVVAMNKLVKSAMDTFVDNPIMDLISYLMDEAMDFAVKVKAIAYYLKERFVDPLCAALMERLTESFGAIEWIKDQVNKVISMMSQMVTDEVVTKSVDTFNESDLVD